MTKKSGERQRDQLVRELGMTEDEQTHCWTLLNSYQSAAINSDERGLRVFGDAIRKRVNWLRTDSGQRWMDEQKL